MKPDVVRIPLSKYVSEFGNFATRAQHLYTIRAEDNRRVKFALNESQRVLDEIVTSEVERTKLLTGYAQVKVICLKSRQVGFTTYTSQFGIDKSLYVDDFRGVVFTHNEKDQGLIWDKYKFTVERVPEFVEVYDDKTEEVLLNIKLRPVFDKYSGTNIKYLDQTESEIYMRHAGSGDAVGKGDTLNFVHFSEAANYDDYTTVKASVSQQLPDNADTYMFIESTANGMTGIGEGFYDEWVTSVKLWHDFKTGKSKNFSGFVPVFVPWYQMKKYSRPIYHGELTPIDHVKFDPITKEKYLAQEQMWHEQLGLSWEQINWYRHNLVAKCSSQLVEAYRYYPTTPEEAFQATTTSMFNTNILVPIKKKYDENIGEVFDIGYVDENFQWVDDEYGNALMRHRPEYGYTNRYYVSLDQSRGKEDGDFSVITVYDRLLDDLAFQWRGKEREDVLAEILIRVGIYYGFATLIPEANMSAVVVLIQPEGLMPYEGEIYIHRINQNGDIQYGYYMDQRSRESARVSYLNWIEPPNTTFNRYSSLIGYDSVVEHINFVRKTKGGKTKFEAQDKFHDDIVMSNIIAVYCGLNDPEPIRFNGKVLDKHVAAVAQKEADKVIREQEEIQKTGKRLGRSYRTSKLGSKFLKNA